VGQRGTAQLLGINLDPERLPDEKQVSEFVRRYLLEQSPLPMREQTIPYALLPEVQEAFVTGSHFGIVPVVQIDNYQFSLGVETQNLIRWRESSIASRITARFVAEREETIMTPTTTVPVKISPDAERHVALLGMQKEFEQILDYMRGHVPDLVGIAVSLHEPYDTGDEDVVVIDAIRTEESFSLEDKGYWELLSWYGDTFHGDVRRHFTLTISHGTMDGR
jgi:hypothetical protein